MAADGASARAPAWVAPVCDAEKTLGVSREIEIDTSTSLVYGAQYHNSPVLLQDKEVVLTFDDGPVGKGTRDILDALDAQCTKATFFMVGRMALAYPDSVKEVERRGHTIGAHTWSHVNLGARDEAGGAAEIEKGFSAVAAALGKPIAPFFRFPYLSDPERMIVYLKKRNVAIWGIDIDSYDTRGFGSTRIAKWTLDHVKKAGKGVILFHDIKSTTQRAIPAVLADLKAAGFKVVHLKPKAMFGTDAGQDQLLAEQFDRLTGKFKSAARSKSRSTTTQASFTDTGDTAAPKSKSRRTAKRRANKRKRKTEAEVITTVQPGNRGA